MYHMVSEPRTPGERRFACPPERFAEHMRLLRAHGYRLVGLDDVHGHLSGRRRLADGALAVTLDDGFADNYENAFPVLTEHRIPATVFVVSGAVGGRSGWMTETSSRRRAMLSWLQMREMHAAGIAFGSHTVTHPHLSALEEGQAMRELRDSKAALEDGLGGEVAHFAYPHGDVSDQVRSLVHAAGYRTACTTRSGFNRPDADPLRLRRLEVYGTDSARNLTRKLRFGVNDGSLGFSLRYYWGRAQARVT